MGLLDGIRELLGLRAEADATRAAAPERLFQLSTGYVTMAANLEFEHAGVAALCFGGVDSTDFTDAVRDVEAILAAGEVDTGTTARFVTDGHGYSWVVLADEDFEDLVTSVHFAADTLVDRGYSSRLLAAVFAFAGADDARAYWIYSFRRGAFYPFAPRADGSHERDNGLEFKLAAVLDGELDVEDDEAYWYPLWPDAPGGHPWE